MSTPPGWAPPADHNLIDVRGRSVLGDPWRGGNFGIVTSFEFRAHPLGPTAAYAGVFYPLADAETILDRWRNYCLNAQDEVTSVAAAVTIPAGPLWPPTVQSQPCLVGGLYAGEAERGMKVMRPLRELGAALADISQTMTFATIQTWFDSLFPMGTLQAYWTAQNLPNLPDAAIAVLVSTAKARPAPRTQVVTFQMGGAMDAIAPTDTPYTEHSAPWMSSIDGTGENAADNAANIAWVREGFRRIAPYSTRTTYTNFTGQADESAGAMAATASART